MKLTQIGKTGKAHGTRGEIKLFVDDAYLEDLAGAEAVLIGDPPIPHFLESLRVGGSIIAKFEDLDQREIVGLLSNQALYLPSDQVLGVVVEEEHPFAHLIDWYIEAEGYGRIGPIVDVLDLPEHYLAQLEIGGNEVFIPLHDDLIIEEREKDTLVIMQLPEGLLP